METIIRWTLQIPHRFLEDRPIICVEVKVEARTEPDSSALQHNLNNGNGSGDRNGVTSPQKDTPLVYF
ncbi:hypothetical protein Ocin01_16157 [Orchesella cincta]|uniref:Uncharacterized protein n=1 Tax=Orchesella cincta TaxID=48709 RepID=A0A1D2MC85_ORCCI|nr:hypothetical protein Ocin01_16157 [Orchesella cincta]